MLKNKQKTKTMFRNFLETCVCNRSISFNFDSDNNYLNIHFVKKSLLSNLDNY